MTYDVLDMKGDIFSMRARPGAAGIAECRTKIQHCICVPFACALDVLSDLQLLMAPPVA